MGKLTLVKLKRWLFRKVIQVRANDSIIKEYRSTGRVKVTLKRQIDASIMRWLMAPGSREEYFPAIGDEVVLGSVLWTFTDCIANKSTELAESTPVLSEARITLMKSGISGESQLKSIRLSEQFCLSLHDSRVESSIEGFAMNADKRETQSFGWDWFLVDSADHATKLQESGELELTFANPIDQIEIIGCKFLTDISFRFSSFEYNMARSVQLYDPQFRLTIKAGSNINWPALVDGVVQMPSPK